MLNALDSHYMCWSSPLCSASASYVESCFRVLGLIDYECFMQMVDEFYDMLAVRDVRRSKTWRPHEGKQYSYLEEVVTPIYQTLLAVSTTPKSHLALFTPVLRVNVQIVLRVHLIRLHSDL